MPQPKPQKKKELKVDTKALQAKENKLCSDLVESPTSKNKYKLLQNQIKELEKANASYKQVNVRCMELILSLKVPQKMQWRVFLDMADFAKRESKFDEARYLFQLVASMQPFAYQGWLEFSKMEEECGNQQKSLDILLNGLKFNPLNENLFIKSIKVQERMGNFKEIRQMIDDLKQKEMSIEKTWRILLEGALFEGR